MVFDRSKADTEFGNILAEDPESATIGTHDFTCNKASLRRQELEQRLQENIENYQFTLSFQASDFRGGEDSEPEPVRGDKLTYGGTIYRILATDKSPDNVELRLHMGSKSSKGK